MRSDPRIWLSVALGIAGIAAGWLVFQDLATDMLAERLGMSRHAITFISIFLLAAGLGVALYLRRFVRVKADLVAGRNVIARWHVDAALFAQVAASALEDDREEKRGALLLVLGFIVAIFGAFALYDAEAAPAMIIMGAIVAVVMAIAFAIGQRVMRAQWQMRSGEVIVGREGVLINDVLHVWRTFLSWLDNARLDEGPPAALVVTYSFISRIGIQDVAVPLPVPPDAMAQAREAEIELRTMLGKRTGRRRARAF